MATAIEKWINWLNNSCGYWTKDATFIAKNKKVVCVKCEGFAFMGDENEGEE